ncbi:MAG: flagellin [Oscillospiraceae bacterium]|nr:flagellin [Oscillospiraceae bacterium]
MRVQHNIMAMNAYRNYTNNVSAMKKNLEKLSSGYKINRAGDDAAGLAISEKMRAQITGLKTAQKNAKDGISLVQTAEGALQEVHDMLNRMVELATQSANGTYDNNTDRDQLQKEVNQLRSEINRIADSANFNGIKLFDGSMEADGVEYSVGSKTDLEILATGTTKVTTAGTNTIVHKSGQQATKTKFSVELENISFATSAATQTFTVTVGGAAITGTGSGNASGADLANAIVGSKGEKEVKIGGVSYNVTAEGSKLVFEMTDAALDKATKAVSYTGNFAVTVGGATGGTQGGTVNLGTQVITEGAPKAGAILANTQLKTALTAKDIVDGKAITVGDTTYVFASKQSTLDAIKEAGTNFKAVDISDLVDENGTLDNNKAGSGSALSEALSRLTVAAKDNKMFTVGQNNTDGTLTFQEKVSYNGDGKGGRADLTTKDGIQKQIQTGTFTANKVQAKNGTGKGLTLQIGDTADSYNQLKVSLGDMHVSSLGIADIDISDQDNAAAAVDAIKAAINKVSDVRGTLGATQNRLDHTINNLSVMTENIQDAESTIRDVDIAEEMMAYTKNNILIQSAQAMLAQANQVPQGVLQLLG